MKSILLAAATCGVLIATAQAVQAAPAQEPALAPFTQFIDAMNKGDVKTASATFAPSPTIIDEFPPFTWHSFAAWNQDLGAGFKADKISDFHITLSPASFKKTDASHGYGVVPAMLSFKAKGKATTEKGMFTFSTVKAAEGWHITGWAWSTL